jgi:hypothetical protein
VEVFKSPKFQFQFETVVLPVDKSVNVDTLLKQTLLPLRFETGRGWTVTACVMVSLHPCCVVTINVTEFVPIVGYVVDVFWLVDEAGVPPAIAQFQDVIGSPTGFREPSVNVTAPPKQGGGLVNAAVGRAFTVTVLIIVSLHPAEQVITSVTV